MSDEPRQVRFLIGSGSIEELIAKRRAEEEQAAVEGGTASSKEESAEILADVMTREEFLGEPDDVEFVQPKRSISRAYRQRLENDR